MGGKNHQPCKKYLPDSTEISRELSLAYAELELGNVVLEDLLLAEVNGGRGSVDGILESLGASSEALERTVTIMHSLRERMDEFDFVDLPTLRSTDLVDLGERFVSDGLVTVEAWSVVSRAMRDNGFVTMLAFLESRVRELVALTRNLSEAVKVLRPAAATGMVTLILEENRRGNLKPAFAKLYCAWSSFNQVFLASSLLSTELWYSFTGRGSLCPVKVRTSEVA